MISSDKLGNGTKRRGESESMKNARMEVAAMKRGDFGRQEKEDQPTYQTTFSGGIFPSHERVGSAEYDRETERLMEALAKRIATGQHQSADFNDARRHVREHRMNGSSGSHRNNNLVHVDNAEVMRLREVKRQLRDDFSDALRRRIVVVGPRGSEKSPANVPSQHARSRAQTGR